MTFRYGWLEGAESRGWTDMSGRGQGAGHLTTGVGAETEGGAGAGTEGGAGAEREKGVGIGEV